MGMIGRAALAAAVLFPFASSPALAESRVAQYGAAFCEDLGQFNRLIEALLRGEKKAADSLDRCAIVNPGVRVDVLRIVDARTDGPSAIAVRIYGNGTSVDGYTLSNDVEDPTPTGQ